MFRATFDPTTSPFLPPVSYTHLVTGEVSTVRISVEDGAVLKGGIQVRSGEHKHQNQDSQKKANEMQKSAVAEAQKAMAVPASA